MNEQERDLDLALAECEQENRLLRARIDRLEREALAQPEQEPVAEKVYDQEDDTAYIQYFIPHDLIPIGTKFYTTPTQRTWVGLEEDEVEACFHHVDEAGIGLFDFAEAIETKLKEKNT
jgi:hypothetical protein